MRDTPLVADRLLSIDWPAWRSVGMAAGGMLLSAAGKAPARRWQTVLSAENDPVTDEHRLGDVPVVPGTRHLDLVVDAFRAEILDGADEPVQLNDVVFQRMLELTSPRRVEVAFHPDGENWTFAVSSAPLTTSSPTDVQTHVRGRVAAWRPDADAPAPRHVDLAELRATLTEHRPRHRSAPTGRRSRWARAGAPISRSRPTRPVTANCWSWRCPRITRTRPFDTRSTRR